MRFVVNKRRIRGSFHGHPNAKGLVAEADITPHARGRLAAKLLVFRNVTALRHFWRDGLGKEDLTRRCWGVVNALAHTRESYDKHGRLEWQRLEGDARYFCVIGLVVGHLSMEVVTHEAVHAGFCYEKRVQRNLFGKACDFDEERIAYPAGAIAAAINRFLHAKGLYEA